MSTSGFGLALGRPGLEIRHVETPQGIQSLIVTLPGPKQSPEYLRLFEDAIRRLYATQSVASGSVLVYLEQTEMNDEERACLLQALSKTAEDIAKQLGVPTPDPPRLQIGSILYSLSDVGELEKRQCKQLPTLVSAQLESSQGGAVRSTSSQDCTQPSMGQQLVITAANAAARDSVRLHFQGDSSTVTVGTEIDSSALTGGVVELTIAVPPDAKQVVAVELLRDGFASQKIAVSGYEGLRNQELASPQESNNLTNYSDVSSCLMSSNDTGMLS